MHNNIHTLDLFQASSVCPTNDLKIDKNEMSWVFIVTSHKSCTTIYFIYYLLAKGIPNKKI